MAIKTKYRLKNNDGIYEVIHFETHSSQVITDDEHQFITLKEKQLLNEKLIQQGYTHNQIAASDTWNIHHSMGKFPSVTIVDSAGSVVVGDISYIDPNTIQIKFTSQFAGIAYLN